MEDHRQVMLFRQLQLGLQHALLALELRVVHIQIESDLPTATSLRGRSASSVASWSNCGS